jgi:hypothetical protein
MREKNRKVQSFEDGRVDLVLGSSLLPLEGQASIFRVFLDERDDFEVAHGDEEG